MDCSNANEQGADLLRQRYEAAALRVVETSENYCSCRKLKCLTVSTRFFTPNTWPRVRDLRWRRRARRVRARRNLSSEVAPMDCREECEASYEECLEECESSEDYEDCVNECKENLSSCLEICSPEEELGEEEVEEY